jgi:hypothetical protein
MIPSTLKLGTVRVVLLTLALAAPSSRGPGRRRVPWTAARRGRGRPLWRSGREDKKRDSGDARRGHGPVRSCARCSHGSPGRRAGRQRWRRPRHHPWRSDVHAHLRRPRGRRPRWRRGGWSQLFDRSRGAVRRRRRPPVRRSGPALTRPPAGGSHWTAQAYRVYRGALWETLARNWLAVIPIET